MVSALLVLVFLPVMTLWVATAGRVDIDKHSPQEASVLNDTIPFFSPKGDLSQFQKGRRYVCVMKYSATDREGTEDFCLADAREAMKVSLVDLNRAPKERGVSRYRLKLTNYRMCTSEKNDYQMKLCSWKGEYPDPNSQVPDEKAYTLSSYQNPRRISYSSRVRVPKSCFSKIFVKAKVFVGKYTRSEATKRPITMNGLQGSVDSLTCERMREARPARQDVFTERFSDAQREHDAGEFGDAPAGEDTSYVRIYSFEDIEPYSKVEELVGLKKA